MSNEQTPGGSDQDRAQSVVDRRLGLPRRRSTAPYTGLEERRGPGRRRTDYTRSAEEGEMTTEQFLFLMAIDAYKRVNGKPFPTWTEVLHVMRKLGYRKTMPSELNLANAEDWTEPPNAPVASPVMEPDDADVHETSGKLPS